MKPKVRLNDVVIPLLISYAAGITLLMVTVWFAFSQGEQFAVLDGMGKDTVITTSGFLGLAIIVVVMAFCVSALSLVVQRPFVIAAVIIGVLVALGITALFGSGSAFLWLGLIIANIGLYRGRSRLYVLSLGTVLFLSQIYNAFARSESVATTSWLIATDVLFAAPIFYVIIKYIPKQNRVSVS